MSDPFDNEMRDEQALYAFLQDEVTLLGDPAGNGIEMNVDADPINVKYCYFVPVGKRVSLHMIHIVIVDTNVTPAKFGGQTALAAGKGCLLQHIGQDGSEILLDWFPDPDGNGIQTNADFNLMSGAEALVSTGGAVGQESFDLEVGGRPLWLQQQTCVAFTIRADLSSITRMRGMVLGQIFSSDD
jgi:hypothetical protein